MRSAGGVLLIVLIAGGVALYLMRLDVDSSADAVRTAAAELRESQVAGRELDIDGARSMIDAMITLVDQPDLVADAVDELKAFSSTAASWAAASPPGPALHAAVTLRRAAGELRQYALQPSPRHLTRARQCLDAARSILEQPSADAVAGEGAGLGVGAVRDQLQNLEQSRREQRQELDESLRE